MLLTFVVAGCKQDNLPITQDPEKFTYLTEEFPPFNYSSLDQAYGISSDLLVELFKGLGLSIGRSAISVSDWSSAYNTALNTPGTMLFSTVRTPRRDSLFKWVGPIAPHSEVILTLKNSGIHIEQIPDLNMCFTGVVSEYSSIEWLLDRGVLRANIVLYDNLSDLYKALVVDREVQCIATSLASHELILQAAGYSTTDFATPFVILADELYYAFNIETGDELINRFQKELDEAKTYKSGDGSSIYEKIMNRYSMILDADDGITDEMISNLVSRTAADVGKDAQGTFSKITQGLAPYVDPQNPALYIFVYDTNVVMMAHGTNPGMVGKSYAGKTDAAGKSFRDEIVAGALANGTGWVDYIYTKPDESGLYRKTSYYQLAIGSDGNKYVVCAGKYK